MNIGSSIIDKEVARRLHREIVAYLNCLRFDSSRNASARIDQLTFGYTEDIMYFFSIEQSLSCTVCSFTEMNRKILCSTSCHQIYGNLILSGSRVLDWSRHFQYHIIEVVITSRLCHILESVS